MAGLEKADLLETKIKIWSRALSSQTGRIPSVSDFNEDRIWEEKEKSVADVLPQFISVAEQTFYFPTLLSLEETL